MKEPIYNFEIIFIFNIHCLKDNTFIPVTLQLHYSVPEVVCGKVLQNTLLQLQLPLDLMENADQRETV